MSEINKYFLLEEGEKLGPYSLEELFDKPVLPDDKVMSPVASEWHKASELPELIYFFKSQGVYYPSAENAAGFWMRLAAHFLDVIFLILISSVILSIVLSFTTVNIDLENEIKNENFRFEIQMISFTLLVFYHSIMESSRLKASFGKYILAIAVVDESGFPLTIGEAFKRNLGKIVSSIIFGVGYLMIFWTEKGQALHDRVSGTFVVNKNK